MKLHSTVLSDSELPQFTQELPKQLNLKTDLDASSLAKFIEDLQGLQLGIAALDANISNE